MSAGVLREVASAAGRRLAAGTPETCAIAQTSREVDLGARAPGGLVPAWALLTGDLAVSAALRVWLVSGGRGSRRSCSSTRRSTAELARSLADTGWYAVREMPVTGYSLLYPGR